jgi:hypothetical protein
MFDDFEMRMRLQRVAAYRDLCRAVRRSGRENIVFALLMLLLASLAWPQLQAKPLSLWLYCIFIGGELLVGTYKLLFPSAEGVLLDGIVLIIFAAYNLADQFLFAPRVNPLIVFLAVYMAFLAVGRFRTYGHLRRLFAERPGSEHMVWFDDLVHEIRHSDPQSDELALDLPTRPHWKVKLLGTTAFFSSLRGNAIVVVGPDDFELLREKTDRGTGVRRAFLRIHDQSYPEFDITDATWQNYQKWRTAHPGPWLENAGMASQ